MNDASAQPGPDTPRRGGDTPQAAHRQGNEHAPVQAHEQAHEHPLIQLIEADGLPRTTRHDCPYLPQRVAREEAFVTPTLPPELYHELMDMGFRRSGDLFYRPRCPDCRACVPLRIDVHAFKPSRSQRRVQRRNGDVEIHLAQAAAPVDDERVAVYQRYLDHQHPGTPQRAEQEELESFLYRDCVSTLEVSYRVGGRLMGASIIDVSERAWSSVYHYFDPAFADRSPGVYSVLAELELCRIKKVPHYYMGYWIAEAPTMSYKANYAGHELLIDGQWQRGDLKRDAQSAAQDDSPRANQVDACDDASGAGPRDALDADTDADTP